MNKKQDKEIWKILDQEKNRQENMVELIASENFVSQEVLDITGSEFINKYAEGYPGSRYYDGCEFVDKIEEIAIDRLKKIFNVKFANVQPHSGSQANSAAFAAILNPGDKILGMSLDSGGHLTHGHKVNFSGKMYQSYFYYVDKETQMINYDSVLKIAKKVKPKLIIAGASSYSRIIDFEKFRKIADEVGSYLLVDMAHIAGLVATGLHPSPIKHAHIITSTTHKTLRGARGGIILTNDEEISKKIDKSIFPGSQGGPLMNMIAGKAISFYEILQPEFKEYIRSVVNNMKSMEKVFKDNKVKLVANGTDNHLLMLDVKKTYNITGQQASDALYKVNIIVNKNSIPFDKENPMVTSGIRIGTAAMTTHGFTNDCFIKLAKLINECLLNYNNENELKYIKSKVMNLKKGRHKYEGNRN